MEPELIEDHLVVVDRDSGVGLFVRIDTDHRHGIVHSWLMVMNRGGHS